MVHIVTGDIPTVFTLAPSELGARDIFRLERIHHISLDNFVLVCRGHESIILNRNLPNRKEIKDTINKIMASKYIPEKLFDIFLSLTDKQSHDILLKYWMDWREKIKKRELHNKALEMLKASKSLRVHWRVKRNKELIKELFEIGFGLYEEEAKCDSQKGAENAFMYGYLLGVQSTSQIVH